MTVRTLPPIVSATRAPASAVPVIAVVCSLALRTLSAVTSAMVGTPGTTVSTEIVRVPAAAEVLPAASVAFTDKVSSPWAIAAMSSAVSV